MRATTDWEVLDRGCRHVHAGWSRAPSNLLDLPSGGPILTGLAMPHSPRVYDGTLHALLSATGELVAVDVERGRYDVVRCVSGFARGLAPRGDYVFVGTSKLREQHTLGDLGMVGRDDAFCGISVIHLPTGACVADLRYLQSCEEIYDVQVLPGLRRPGLLGIHDEAHRMALALPEQTFWGREPGRGDA